MENDSLLELFSAPAFCAQNGTIRAVNQAAKLLGISPDTPLQPLLSEGLEEYASFTGGCLFLRLLFPDGGMDASVRRIDGEDYFVLEPESPPQLQALALAARELRKPLASLMTVMDSLLTVPELQTSDGEEKLCQLNRGLYQLLRMVGNMSDAAGPIFHPEVRDITAILREVLESAQARFPAPRLEFSLPEQALYAPVDEALLERAILNLISNSLKYTPESGKILCGVTKKGKKLFISVSDTGSGIPPAQLGTVFSRYLRAPAVEDGRQGIGLGMTIVRATAAAHGGAVLIDQPEGMGLRVTMTLSLRQDDSVQLRSPIYRVDYGGDRSHALIELSDCLPWEEYT